MREKFGASRFAECRNGHVQPTTSTAGPSSALMHDRLEKQLPKVIAKRRHRWGKFDDGVSRLLSAVVSRAGRASRRSEEHTSELQSHSDLVFRLLLVKKK